MGQQRSIPTPGRRQVLGASALGISSLVLPAATAAASPAPFVPSGAQLLAATTGATVSGYTSGGTSYVVHTFSSTSGGTFTPTEDLTVEYVVVAGGGGGGGGSDRNRGAGGGGAGGFVSAVQDETSVGGAAAQPTLALTSGREYSIVVGAGGGGGVGTLSTGNHTLGKGANGGDSRIVDTVTLAGLVTAVGGGGGAGGRYNVNETNNSAILGDGEAGGSGGGAGSDDLYTDPDPDEFPEGGAAEPGQGNRGGDSNTGNGGGGGGGGGAGGAGAPGAANNESDAYDGGAGGPGLTTRITGVPLLLAAGGPGGDAQRTLSGPRPDAPTAPGSGGVGRDGAWTTGDGPAGGDGVDGIVIIRYALTD